MPKRRASNTQSRVKSAATKVITDIFSEIYSDAKQNIPTHIKRFKEIAKLQFLKAQRILKGKTLVILGPPAAGKATLIRVLRHPSISGTELKSYEKTEVEAVQTYKCEWKVDIGTGQQIPFRLRIKKTSDVGGESQGARLLARNARQWENCTAWRTHVALIQTAVRPPRHL